MTLDDGDYFRTGEIVAQIGRKRYLCQFDNMVGDNSDVVMPAEVVHVSEITMGPGPPSWSLFNTRADLMGWLDWLNTPAKPKVGPKVVSLKH